MIVVAAALVPVLAIVGCKQQAEGLAPPASAEAALPIDGLQRANRCTTQLSVLFQGTISPPSTMTMGNDGGWCWIAVQVTAFGTPSASVLQMRRAPSHGQLLIGRVGERSRVAYRPEPGFVGNDSFTVVNLTFNLERVVNVTVSPP
jgi:hypothetical protein